jgi:hypothetical protein
MRTLQLVLALGLLVSCSRTSNQSTYEKFVDGYYNHGFESIEDLLSDTILLKDGEYVAKYSKLEYQVYYKWDSVFCPKYEMIELIWTDSTVDITQSVSSKRYEFLGNNPLLTRNRLYFVDGKITMIENLEYLNVDWNVWTANRDSLVDWIDFNHKELSGFIFDMTQVGAENYLKAIGLYKNNAL